MNTVEDTLPLKVKMKINILGIIIGYNFNTEQCIVTNKLILQYISIPTGTSLVNDYNNAQNSEVLR